MNKHSPIFHHNNLIQFLTFNNNLIQFFHPNAFSYLRILDLANNHLINIYTRFLFSSVTLSVINLSTQSNALLKIDDYAFERDSSKGRWSFFIIDLNYNAMIQLETKAFCTRNNSESSSAKVSSIKMDFNSLHNLNPCIFRQLKETNVSLTVSNRCDCEMIREISNFFNLSVECANRNRVGECKCSSSPIAKYAHYFCENQKEYDCPKFHDKPSASTISMTTTQSAPEPTMNATMKLIVIIFITIIATLLIVLILLFISAIATL